MNHEERKHLAESSVSRVRRISLEPEEEVIFAEWLSILNDTGIAYFVGGAFALQEYTCIWRFTKDVDVFVKPQDVKRALAALSSAGYETEIRDRAWLAKATRDSYLLDIIFSVANGYIEIDDTWFDSGVPGQVAGVATRLAAVEELIASKIYVTRSDRFDGADIAHIIEAMKGKIRWERVLEILKEDVTLLLWHLVLFSYIYPGRADYLPRQLMVELFEKVKKGWHEPKDPNVFYGRMIDPLRFEVDVADWGYRDERGLGRPLVDEEGNKV